MKPGKNKKAKPPTFEETAAALGCDDDKGRFEKRLGKIAKAKSKSETKQ